MARSTDHTIEMLAITDAFSTVVWPLCVTQSCTPVCATGTAKQRTAARPNPKSAHIEPLEPELPHGTDASAERVATIRAALMEFAARGAIHDIHNVRVRNTDAGEIVNFHCRAAPSMSVIKVHECVDEIERALRRAFPSIKRVISHAEPPRA